jgi:alpha-beta hydrolase superfamily lysophospholipase/predicted GNAT family N-acyltransferase
MDGSAVRTVVGDWEGLGADASRVRTEVFVREQGIPADLEWDAADRESLHCVAYVGDVPVGTGRLLPDAHIGRMAVLAEHRARGVGARILGVLVHAAIARGEAEVLLSAQVAVTGFYAAHGFEPEGPPHVEVGIPHQRMRRVLREGGADAARARESSRTMADGTELAVRDWIPRWPDVRGVYLLHGLGEHCGRYDALARWFCARGWTVRAHDHVGHGRSSGRRGVVARHGQLVEHARAMLDEFAAQLGTAPLLLGHSLGGALAAELVVGARATVSGLVLSSPALDTGLGVGQRALLATLETLAPDRAVANGLDPNALSHEPAVVQAYTSDPLVHDRISGRLLRWLVDSGPGSIEKAATLSVPTLLMVAGSDRLVKPAGSRRFAERAPSSMLTLEWYDALFHEIFNERAEERAQVLADLGTWLDTLPSRAAA